MENKYLSKENLKAWLTKIIADSKQVYAPVQQWSHGAYRRISAPADMTDDFVVPENSVKSFVFPASEKLFAFTKGKDGVTVADKDLEAIPYKVILAVRPCDALGINNLASIFKWEPDDPIFRRRAERTTIIGLACNRADDDCFCTSIGGSPGGTQGSDILLTKTDTGDYIAEIITPKGEAIVAAAPELFEDGAHLDKEKYLANVPQKFDDTHLDAQMKAAFDTPIFDEYALRCIGCSACAYVCPVCGCFDIQDTTKGSRGQRIRCWDSCGAKLFTLHTSGHNPRDTQGARWRQRLMHKFAYMPERLKVRCCVGCGRCSRHCPVDMNISEQLTTITHRNS